MFPNFEGGIFIDEQDNYRYVRKRGAQVLRSVLTENDRGIIGSDVVWELGFSGTKRSLGFLTNENGEPLRFALLVRPGDKQRFESKANNKELLRIATSYPRIASQGAFSGANVAYSIEEGGVEQELVLRPELDAAFELVQSGDTMRAYGLEIAYDDLNFIELMEVRKGDER